MGSVEAKFPAHTRNALSKCWLTRGETPVGVPAWSPSSINFDNDGYAREVVASGFLRVPRRGLYLVTFACIWDASLVATRFIAVVDAGVLEFGQTNSPPPGTPSYMTCNAVVGLEKGDQIGVTLLSDDPAASASNLYWSVLDLGGQWETFPV